MNNYDKLTMNEKRQFWKEKPLNGNILIKIDTEETELNVLKGMVKLLNENNVDMLIDRNKSKFSSILKGYKIHEFGRNFFILINNINNINNINMSKFIQIDKTSIFNGKKFSCK